MLALEAMADRQAEFAPFVPGVDDSGSEPCEVREVREARAVLRGVPALRDLGDVERLTPFQCVVLDKLEGVLTGDLLVPWGLK